MSLRIGGLFEGYGGLTMGVRQALGDGELAWYSEHEPPTKQNPNPTQGAARLLAHHHPGVPNLGDITKVDWSQVEPVDVLCGGFPCQDVSSAGRQAGLRPGTRSGLWAHFAYAIDQLRPALVVIENVRGLLTARGAAPTDELLATWAERDKCDRILRLLDSKHSRAVREGKAFYVRQHATDRIRILGRRKRAVAAVRRADARIVRAIGAVLGSLADLGYDAVWYGLRAAEVGAPHGRFRIFIVAYPSGQPWRLEHRDCAGAGVGLISDDSCPLLPTPLNSDAGPRGGTTGYGLRDWSRSLLPTPNAALGRGTGTPSPATAQSRYGQGKRYLDDALALLPTPRVQSGGGAGPTPGRVSTERGMDLSTAAALLPTPRARDGKGNDPNPRGVDLNEAISLLPTPSVADALGGHRSRSGHRSEELLLPGVVLTLLPTPRATDGSKGGPNQRGSSGDPRNLGKEAQLLPTPTATPYGRNQSPSPGAAVRPSLDGIVDWGKYELAIRRWESALRRCAPAPTEPNRTGGRRLAPVFGEWMMGLPLGHVTDPAIGLTRNEQLKLIGNGVVPQQAAVGIRLCLARAAAIGAAA